MTLTEFLSARIAEDEDAARRAWDRRPVAATWAGPQLRAGMAETDLLRRFPPARILAECEAKRRIVENCANAREALRQAPSSEQFSSKDGPVAAYWRGQDWTCRILALPYADHPDYCEEWKP